MKTTTNRTFCESNLTTNLKIFNLETVFADYFRFPIRRCFGSAEKKSAKAFLLGEFMPSGHYIRKFIECSISDCHKKHKGRGFCEMHLMRLKKFGDVNFKSAYHNTPEEHFWNRIAKGDNNKCWEWQKARGGGKYGRVWWEGKLELAHRIAFLLSGGNLTEEQDCVLHSCDNPPCCNPNHLSAGSYGENNAQLWARNSKKRSKFAKLVEFQNEIHTVAEWSRMLGLNYGALISRLNKGWDVEKALTTPVVLGRNQYPT